MYLLKISFSKLFWFHKKVPLSSVAYLVEANLDGTTERVLYQGNLLPSSATIDYTTNVIYWGTHEVHLGYSSIQAYDLKTNLRTVVRSNLPVPKGLLVFKDYMIFADNDSPKTLGIQSFPLKGNGTVKELLRIDTWVSDITALHSSMQTGKSFECLCIASSKQS